MNYVESKPCKFCNGEMRKLYHHGEYAWSDRFSFDQKTEANVFVCADCGKVMVLSKDGLKPCPFCGSEVGVHERGGYDYYEPYWVVECGKCEAGMESFGTREAAIEAWNTRV